MERGGQSYFYQTDGLGSITQITDSLKQIVASYEYDAFGNIIAQTGSLANPYTFTSREHDPESGLYYYRARYYDPKIGRFLQPDPLDMAAVILIRQYFPGNPISGLLYQYALRNPMFISNMYLYCLNNAINIIDPEGLHGFMLIGRTPILIGKEPYIFRPLHLRYPMPRYVPRPLPKTIPRPILRPAFKPPPQIVRPQPMPWWYFILRFINQSEEIMDPYVNPYFMGVSANPCDWPPGWIPPWVASYENGLVVLKNNKEANHGG